MTKTLLIMAGGTGGHVIPGLAVAAEMQQRGWQVVWLGTAAGLESKLVPERGIRLETLSMAGVRGKGFARLALLPFHLLRAFVQAWRILGRIKPDAVLGMGGYAAFPGGLMAVWRHIPLALHEQNACAGLTNRVLATMADAVLLGLPGALRKATWVGNPVRTEIAALAEPALRLGSRTGPLHLLVIGGSLGAAALNALVPEALAKLPAEMRPRVRHQSGGKNLHTLQENYAAAAVEAECIAFIDDMASAYDWADVVLCRAGASTVSEVAVAGVAAGFVPFPHAVDDHQTANARCLVNVGAGWLLPQSTLTAQTLADWLSGLDRAILIEHAAKARTLAKPLAAAAVADVIEEWVR